MADWIGCHANALEAFGSVPALLVPDNAKRAFSASITAAQG